MTRHAEDAPASARVRPRLIVLPGMGADSSMYGGAWRALEHAAFPDWPAYRGERTLRELARRVVDENAVTADDLPCGVSLGGMVALEVADLVGAPHAALVSSAVHPREVRNLWRALSVLAPVAPIGLARRLVRHAPGRLRGTLRGADPPFVRATIRAVLDWEPPAYTGRVVRVHGDRDAVLRCTTSATNLPGRGHLAAITHASETIDALRRALAEVDVAL